MLDIGIVLIGFWITQQLYPYVFGSSVKVALWKFIVLFLCIQIFYIQMLILCS
jgi:hypothetical protein